MVFGKGNLGYFVAFVLVGSILGTALGAMLGSMVPALAVLRQNIVPSAGIDLVVMSISFNINPVTVLGMASGVFLFYKV